MLLLDRIRQSYVDLDDPTYLEFEYMRWMSHVVDAQPEGPLAVTHIGGGAATMVRYLGAVRPGQQPDRVRARRPGHRHWCVASCPSTRGVRVRIRPRRRSDRSDPARASPARMSSCSTRSPAAGCRPSSEPVEFAADVARVLRPAGVLIANIGDGGRMTYTRRFVAALRRYLPHALVVTDKAVLNGRRYGNIVVAASARTLPMEPIRRGLLGEPFPVQAVTGRDLERWLGGAAPFTDADCDRSPSPPEETWRVALD